MKPTHPYEIRPDDTDEGMEIDEIVAQGVDFHMEALHAGCYWFSLTFPDRERLTFTVHMQERRRRLRARVTEKPRRKQAGERRRRAS